MKNTLFRIVVESRFCDTMTKIMVLYMYKWFYTLIYRLMKGCESSWLQVWGIGVCVWTMVAERGLYPRRLGDFFILATSFPLLPQTLFLLHEAMASTQDKVTQVNQLYDTVLILDFGSQYSHLITRRIRELGVYCELLPCTQKLADLHFKPKGIILSGSPYSVYDKDAPRVDPAVFDAGVPILGICYGLQEMTTYMGGKVEACEHREYGHAMLSITKHSGHPFMDKLFDGLDGDIQVNLSRISRVIRRLKDIGMDRFG